MPDLKPAVQETLDALVEGHMIVELDLKAQCGRLESFDGTSYRDPEYPDRKMLVPGVYTLFTLGLLDQFGVPTAAGRAAASN